MAENLTEISHKIISAYFKDKPIFCAIDATVGNGFDSLFLARNLADGGRLFGFDVQPQAINSAKELLSKNGVADCAELFLRGHERMCESVGVEFLSRVDCIVFNLGWLPKSDKSIVTKPETTLAALEQSVKLLKPDGLLNILSYRAHVGGESEYKCVCDFLGAHVELEVERHADFDNEKSPVLFSVKSRKNLKCC